MHQRENYQDFLKWGWGGGGGEFLGHSLKMIKELEGLFPKICNLTPPTIRHKRVCRKIGTNMCFFINRANF